MSRQDDIKNLLRIHFARLQNLKEKQAFYGMSVDPSIVMEIEKIEAEIEDLQAELKEIEDRVEASPRPDITARTGQREPEEVAVSAQIPDAALKDAETISELQQPVSKRAQKQVEEDIAERSIDTAWLKIRKRRISVRVTLLAILGVLVVIGLGELARQILFFSSTSEEKEAIRVGVAKFVACAPAPEGLEKSIAQKFGNTTVTFLNKISDSTAARAYTNLDLVIWGQCSQANQLTMHLEILTRHGPEEVIELENITAQTSALDLDRASRLGRTVISYLRSDHDEAASSFVTLQQEARTPSEQAELAFLRANSLLFAGHYEEAMAMYDEVLAYNPLQAQAYNNRGVARVNWALMRSRSEPTQSYDDVLQAAIADLTAATASTDPNIKVLAYVNRGAAKYWVVEDFDQALVDCEQAITLAPAQPLGYVCRAATRYWMLEEAYCHPPPDTTSARNDLATAQSQAPHLMDVFFWRGSLAFLQADCDAVEHDKQEHQQEALQDFQMFLELANKQPVKLFTDQKMIEFASPD